MQGRGARLRPASILRSPARRGSQRHGARSEMDVPRTGTAEARAHFVQEKRSRSQRRDPRRQTALAERRRHNKAPWLGPGGRLAQMGRKGPTAAAASLGWAGFPSIEVTAFEETKLLEDRFTLDIAKNFFAIRVCRVWNRLPAEAVQAPTLDASLAGVI